MRKLMSLQRTFLISVIKGYITISHDAVRAMSRIIPIVLMTEERIRRRDDNEAGVDHRESGNKEEKKH